MADVTYVPHNYPQLSPVLSVRAGDEAIDFYARVLGASVRLRLDAPDGGLNYAELEIGGAVIMLSGEKPGGALNSPSTLLGTTVRISLYVEDVDAVFNRALSAGAEELGALKNQSYGDRVAQFRDPFGHCWNIATHTEDPSAEENPRSSQTTT